MNYKSEDIVLIIGGKDKVVINGFSTAETFVSARMWHKARRLDNGNWLISVTHNSNRVMDIELTDESYNRYGFEDMRPSMVNPFNIEYDDKDLVEILK